MPQGFIKSGDIVERTGYTDYATRTYPNQEERERRFGAIGVPLVVNRVTGVGNLILEGLDGSHSAVNFIIKKRKHYNFNIVFVRNELSPAGDYIIQTQRFASLGTANVFIRDFARDFPGWTIVAKKKVSYYINIPRG